MPAASPRSLALFLGLTLAACTIPGTGDDTGTATGDGGTTATTTDDGTGFQGCDEVTIDHIGTDNPAVGDDWTIWLYCDNALLTGPTVIRFDPLDFALVYDNVVTWTTAGTGTLFVQTGAMRTEEEVTVSK